MEKIIFLGSSEGWDFGEDFDLAGTCLAERCSMKCFGKEMTTKGEGCGPFIVLVASW